MNRRSIRTWNDDRGATLVLVALSMFLLLGMAALAVDMAAAFAWRTEAQRVADASSLAGASAFIDVPADVAEAPARERAYEYALAHTIKGEAVDSSEVTVQVVLAERLVRVGINRPNMPVWFARILGFGSVDIGAVAAAQAAEAGSARCLKPFAVPDAWDDFDDDTNGDNVWQEGEEWAWASNPADRYQRFDPDAADGAGATGYGSDLRDPDNDWGRPLQLKAQDPSSEFDPAPGIFLPWRLPTDPEMGSCERGGGGGLDAGAAVFRRNICACNTNAIELGVEYPLEPGNMRGPTWQGVRELIESDPDVYWEPAANEGKGGVARPDPESPTGWTEVGTATPRVVKLALFDPAEITGPGMDYITFNNFALMFLEDMPSMADPVQARFMYFAGGEGPPGDVAGPLVLYLRLVE